jgi:integrase
VSPKIRRSSFWADLKCSDIRGPVCRRFFLERRIYVGTPRERPASAGSLRREMNVLQAAINYAVKEGRLTTQVKVTLPKADPPRDRWLTRDEVARLLRAAPEKLRRFILISVYTGTRSSAVIGLRWTPSLDSGWVDLERGIIHRKGRLEQETRKRRGSVRMPRQLWAHMRRWARDGGDHVVGYASHRSMHKAWKRACEVAGIEDATPHSLKHSAVTWAFQRGMSREDASDYFDTSPATLESVYRQHSPHHQSRAVEIMERRR